MAFPGAYFEKDNDARSGSKGDFILTKPFDYVRDEDRIGRKRPANIRTRTSSRN
nr:hypothetical protein [Aristaeella lactis]